MKTHKSPTQLHSFPYQEKDSCSKAMQYCLDNIKKKHHLNAFVTTYAKEAKQRAFEVDEKIHKKGAGKLAGAIIGLKDLLCYQDHPVQACSKILQGFIAPFNATAVQRLLQEDAIIIGHQNCDEFGMGSANINSVFGPAHNPIDPTRVPGGSSGGSAAAVQANMCQVALGTDTGGSVRQPAAFCGVVGLKPTYGRVSRHGLIAYASSFDTIGILANQVKDCAAVLEVIAGKDAFDNTVSQQPVPMYTQQKTGQKKIKIAYLKQVIGHHGLQEAVKKNTMATLNFLKKEGHVVAPVDFPLLEYMLPIYYILSPAEASANLARFDGVRYGHRAENAGTLAHMYTKTRTEGFGKEVQRRILLGTFVLSADYHDAYYVKAQKVRRLIQEKTQALLSEYDFIVSPTTPTTAFKPDEHIHNPIAMYLADLFTVQASLAGIPAISIPNGVDNNGLPIGLQIMANAFEEKKLLGFADELLALQK